MFSPAPSRPWAQRTRLSLATFRIGFALLAAFFTLVIVDGRSKRSTASVCFSTFFKSQFFIGFCSNYKLDFRYPGVASASPHLARFKNPRSYMQYSLSLCFKLRAVKPSATQQTHICTTQALLKGMLLECLPRRPTHTIRLAK